MHGEGVAATMNHHLVMEKGLPSNVDAERYVLGSILLDGARFDECAASLEMEDFALEAHRRIWFRMGELALRGVFIDRVTVAEELERFHERESVGGLSYLVSLDEGMPHIPNLGNYCTILKDKSILRKVCMAAQNLMNIALLGEEAPLDLLGRADAMVRALTKSADSSEAFLGPGEVIRAAGGLQSYLERGEGRGLLTGLAKLDELTGGLRAGHLWVIAAYTAGGKSTLAAQIAQHFAACGNPGAFVSLEMTVEEVTDGLICRAGGINTQSIRRGYYDRGSVSAAANKVAELPLYICDRPGSTIPKIHAELRRLKADKGISFAVVDYLQLMQSVGKFGSRAEEVSSLTRGLKLIGMDLGIGMIALSQLRRPEAGKPRRPELSDLKESSSIEQDANLVLMLWTEYQLSLIHI